MLSFRELSIEEQQALRRFMNTPEWNALARVFQSWIDDINRLDFLGTSDKLKDVSQEVEVAAKLIVIESLGKILSDMELIRSLPIRKGVIKRTAE